MSDCANRFLKFAYYFGVSLGIFTFTYNSSTKTFKLSKILQIYKKVIAITVLVLILLLCFMEKSMVPTDNMVIHIATPLNFFLLAAIVLNCYIFLSAKDQEIINMMNSGLKLKNDVGNDGANYEFSFKFFMRTFALDGLFQIFLGAVIYRGLFVRFIEKKLLYMMIFLQSGKNVNRFMTHLYICGIDFNNRLMINVEMKVKESIEKFENFLEVNPQHSKYHFVKKCCRLSDELDYIAIQGRKISDLINGVHSLFSSHILLMIVYNMTDVLMLVNMKLV